MASKTVYLITGANRGLGLALIKHLATQPPATPASEVIIYATVRDPAGTSAQELQQVAKAAEAEGDKGKVKVVILKADVTKVEELKDVKERVEKEVGWVDVVIANAGINTCFEPVLKVTPEALREHFEVNTISSLLLFQTFYPLLTKPASSPGPKKFVVISSGLGSIQFAVPVPVTPYATSKAAGNMVVRKIDTEHRKDGILAVAIHPGALQTEMGLSYAQALNSMEDYNNALKPEVSAKGVIEVIQGATVESAAGKFLTYQGAELPW